MSVRIGSDEYIFINKFMKVTKYIHESVSMDGKVENGGSVITEGMIRMSDGEGCCLDNCHCSDGHWISVGLPINKGIIEGIVVHFDNQEEMNLFFKTHELIDR